MFQYFSHADWQSKWCRLTETRRLTSLSTISAPVGVGVTVGVAAYSRRRRHSGRCGDLLPCNVSLALLLRKEFEVTVTKVVVVGVNVIVARCRALRWSLRNH